MEEEEKARLKQGGGFDWQFEQQYVYGREMLMAAGGGGGGGGYGLFSHPKPRRPLAADLLQNCDLPPPAKLFGPAVAVGSGGADAKSRAAKKNTPFPNPWLENELGGAYQSAEDDQNISNLLRAVRLSQSRAREAEKKLAAEGARSAEMAVLLLRQSLALSTHRRWVMLLEAENSALRGQDVEEEPRDGDGAESPLPGVAAWWVALAVCLGIAGVGFALGKFLL